MKSTKDKLHVHFIHSVKGGCGKTAYSVFKLVNLAANVDSSAPKRDRKAKVLYLDADFKGTASKTLLYGKTEDTFKSMSDIYMGAFTINDGPRRNLQPNIRFAFEESYRVNHLNDFLAGSLNFCDIVVHGGIINPPDPKDEGDEVASLEAYVDFIFSSPWANDKERFGGNDEESDFSTKLNIGVFEHRMDELIQQIFDASQYTDLVVDLPPGEDDYCKILLKVFAKYKSKKKIYSSLYFITTNDLGHIDAENEDFVHALRRPEKVDGYDRYVMVYNELRKNEFTETVLDEFISALKVMIEEYPGAYRDRVWYQKCEFNNTYYKFCRKREEIYIGYKLSEEILLFR